jgi:hypothetical protein
VPSTDNVSTTKNISQYVGSLLNTTWINETYSEVIQPDLHWINDNTGSEYKFGFNYSWLEIEAGAQTEKGNFNIDSEESSKVFTFWIVYLLLTIVCTKNNSGNRRL